MQGKHPTERDCPLPLLFSTGIALVMIYNYPGLFVFCFFFFFFLLSVSTSKPGVSNLKESDGKYF